MNQKLVKACLLLAVALSVGCLPANGKQPRASYPRQLHGVWQGDDLTCVLPENLDSDVRMEIKPYQLIDYEQWNEPTMVVQVSKQPLAWRIKSRLHIDEHAVDQYEIYVLSGSDLRILTVIDENRSAIYARCK